MACLFLVSCISAEPAYCITDNDGALAFSTSLIQLWNDFQVTNPGYAPLIRLYNGNPASTPFTVNNGLPQPIYGCYHVVYVSGGCDCSSITLFPGMGDIPSRTATQVEVGGTTGYVIPTYTSYDANPLLPTNQSVSCDVCTNAIGAYNCSTNDFIEIYNSLYNNNTGNANANANWNILYNGLTRPVIQFGNNQYLTAGCYSFGFPEENSLTTWNSYTVFDVQDLTAQILPVTAYESNCQSCGGSNAGSAFKLADCTNTHTYYLLDNTSASGSLNGYNSNVVTLTLPTSLTGLSNPVTTCVRVSRSASNPSYGYHDLGTITTSLSCSVCSPCYKITSCEGLSYNIFSINNDIKNLLDSCSSQCNGCQPTIYLNYPETEPAQCWTLSSCSNPDLNPVNIDFYDPLVYTLGCNNQPCLACNSTCYKIALCPCSGGEVIILASPEFNTAPVLDTIVEATVTVGSIDDPDLLLYGCMTITELPDCNAINNLYPIFTPSTVVIGNPPVVHNDCQECCPPPPGYRLTRCDDPAISFIASNDLSTLVGKVIRNIKITNCNSTVGICSSIKEDQCWKVDYYDFPGDFNIVYDPANVLANCDCCPGPCD